MNVVQFVDRNDYLVYYPQEGSYSKDVSKKHVWLQNICFKILDKLGCQTYKPSAEVTYTTVSFDPSKFVNHLLCQKDYFSRIYNQDVDYVLVGAEDFRQIIGTEEIRQVVCFEYGVPLSRGSHTKICGVKVKVVPWMSGMICVPKEYY